MRKISTTILVCVVFASMTGCPLNPFAEDNIYKTKPTETSSKTMQQRSAPEINSHFQKVDIDKDGVISKQEAETIPGLAAVFHKYNPDRDAALDWNEFTAAMQSMNLSKN
jgi:Ca2+-binding EF-hand superfamily protein